MLLFPDIYIIKICTNRVGFNTERKRITENIIWYVLFYTYDNLDLIKAFLFFFTTVAFNNDKKQLNIQIKLLVLNLY